MITTDTDSLRLVEKTKLLQTGSFLCNNMLINKMAVCYQFVCIVYNRSIFCEVRIISIVILAFKIKTRNDVYTIFKTMQFLIF